ncbi:MAG: 2-C-methyl-D-erythritol 4-phosphate cytidylyltransferase [Bacteroidia bacterium]|nr:MAG: 2-C-methyl-D-erythritol 4-phosphate cytidylyltransferase [Bacteroidia bacterium]
MTNKALVLVAGGIGERAETKIPKQFVEINHQPILVHTLQKFLQYDSNLICVIVIHPDYKGLTEELLQKFFRDNRNIFLTNGGQTRFESVKNGLGFLKQKEFSGIVAVHDAARPCITLKLIQRCFDMAKESGNAIPVIPVSESMRKIIGEESTLVRREDFRIVQTPQCADFNTLYSAFQQPFQEIFTDEANVLESAGVPIFLCEGERHNIKITYPIDFKIAEVILNTINS